VDRPIRYKTISGVASAGAHVAGCAALWAETSTSLRGMICGTGSGARRRCCRFRCSGWRGTGPSALDPSITCGNQSQKLAAPRRCAPPMPSSRRASATGPRADE
jgi:hypothetical protein